MYLKFIANNQVNINKLNNTLRFNFNKINQKILILSNKQTLDIMSIKRSMSTFNSTILRRLDEQDRRINMLNEALSNQSQKIDAILYKLQNKYNLDNSY